MLIAKSSVIKRIIYFNVKRYLNKLFKRASSWVPEDISLEIPGRL